MSKLTKYSVSFDEVGKRLSMLRKSKNLTQKQLADRIQVSRQMISTWENGKAEIPIGRVLQLCKALGVDADYYYSEQRYNPKTYYWIHDNVATLLKVVEKAQSADSEIEKKIYRLISDLGLIATFECKTDSIYTTPIAALDSVCNYTRIIQRDLYRRADIDSKVELIHQYESDRLDALSLSKNELSFEEAAETEVVFKTGYIAGKVKEISSDRLNELYSLAGYQRLDIGSFKALGVYINHKRNMK